MQESPRSLTLIMVLGGIALLFILGAILGVSITEAMLVGAERDVARQATVMEEAGLGSDGATPVSADTGTTDTSGPTADESAATDDTQAQIAAPVALESVPVTDELIAAFTSGTCTACHVIPDIPGAVGQIGPDLSHIGSVAATRVPGESALEYIHHSIVDPMAFIAPDCPTGPCIAGTMPPGLDQLVSAEELNLMANYLAGLE